MTKKEVESFLGSSFFNALISYKHPKPEWDYIDNIFSQVEFETHQDGVNYFCNTLLEKYYDISGEVREPYFRDKYREIAGHAVLKAFIVNDLLQYFCEELDVDKIIKIVDRKQFDSKIIKQTEYKILAFLFLLNLSDSAQNLLASVIFLDIKRMIDEYDEAFIIKEMESLRKIVDKVASGVNKRCYLEFLSKSNYGNISGDLKAYIKEKYGYILENEFEYAHKHSCRYYLSYALVNDSRVWDKNRSILDFLFYVEKFNDLQHAKKIIDYAFEELCKNPKFKFLYDKKLPFYFIELENILLNSSKRCFEGKYSKLLNVTLTEGDAKGFLYPLYDGYDEMVKIGKKVFENFIANAYKNESEKVLSILSDSNNKIQDDESLEDGRSRRELTFEDYVDYEMIGYQEEYEKMLFLKSYYDNFMTNDSVLGRFYYRIYLIQKYAKDNYSEFIFEDLYYLFEMIDFKYGTSCSYQKDEEFRDANYNALKKILLNYGFEIDDKFKPLYIISLLDRKYASIDEASHFAELEQYGDAIYDLAADNILFYDEAHNYELTTQNHIELVKAEAQVKVAKKLGIDKIYISKLHSSLNLKFESYESYDEGLRENDPACDKKYIADSLEMIIGVLAKEFGVQKALDFATTIIIESNPEYHKPEILDNTDYISMITNHWDEYLRKIFARAETMRDSDYSYEYDELWLGLGKVIKIAIIGNETKEKRKMIANNTHWILTAASEKANYQPITKYHYISYYLFHGIEDTIKTFKDIVESNYKNYKY